MLGILQTITSLWLLALYILKQAILTVRDAQRQRRRRMHKALEQEEVCSRDPLAGPRRVV